MICRFLGARCTQSVAVRPATVQAERQPTGAFAFGQVCGIQQVAKAGRQAGRQACMTDKLSDGLPH